MESSFPVFKQKKKCVYANDGEKGFHTATKSHKTNILS